MYMKGCRFHEFKFRTNFLLLLLTLVFCDISLWTIKNWYYTKSFSFYLRVTNPKESTEKKHNIIRVLKCAIQWMGSLMMSVHLTIHKAKLKVWTLPLHN